MCTCTVHVFVPHPSYQADKIFNDVYCVLLCTVYSCVLCTVVYCVQLCTVVYCSGVCAAPQLPGGRDPQCWVQHCVLLCTVYCCVLCTVVYCVLLCTVYCCVLCTVVYCVLYRCLCRTPATRRTRSSTMWRWYSCRPTLYLPIQGTTVFPFICLRIL